jgi:hypothetical protein
MTVTVSTASSAAKFFRLSSAVRVFVLHAARRNHSSGSVSGLRVSARCTSDLVGTQPMLMHVPPYIWSDCSIMATRAP